MDVMTTVSELQPDLRLITRAEFTRMHEADLFADEQVELLEGVIVTMAAEGGPHVRGTMWLNNHFARSLPDAVMVGVNHPYAAGDLSQPQPDLVVVAAEDVVAVVEGDGQVSACGVTVAMPDLMDFVSPTG